MRSVLHNFFSALAPRTCLSCNDKSMANLFCESCSESIQYASNNTAEHAAIFMYSGAIAQAIKRAKFTPSETVARSLASFIHNDHVNVNSTIDAITFVPLHWKRRMQRGFDMSSIFAQHIAHVSHKPLVDILQCNKYAAALSLSSSAEQRHSMVADRYSLRTSKFSLKKILIVDDIVTTGATLSAAAKPLQQKGIDVAYFAFARTPLHRNAS